MPDPVLLAVAHGTSYAPGIATLHALLERVRELAPGLRVELAFVDHEPPSVRGALNAFATDGVPVATLPLLLTAASHSKGDIAGTVRLVRDERPGFAVSYGRPLGPDPLLLQALADRVAEAGAGPDTALVLASAGAADPDANAEIWRAARLFWEYRGGGAPVEVAYASATTPTVTDAVRRLRTLGHDDVLVVPYFLAPGKLPSGVRRDAQDAGARAADVLGAHDAVARLVLARYAEAVGGTVLMNCDTCQYRSPWPGRENKVGQLQQPHTHPADEAVSAG
ncbi:sirohydrochlorin chelatase [Cryptosporangium aurantiacum]|uniref:Sirohydrochlorin cobaltochelatase n=1 Tax=Cryptosporangium aurantiacum TaxID=134849 RepID=A0A1M7IMZ8_9ACTN|nr:sirohydrochlorin chelatase [Cryptosporangium aurantiacum]SHM42045.1 sirohydrochlorin cobaltochelatase [Cryptosporangium aurantiacum]